MFSPPFDYVRWDEGEVDFLVCTILFLGTLLAVWFEIHKLNKIHVLATTLHSNVAPYAFILAKLLTYCMKVIIQIWRSMIGTRPDMKKNRVEAKECHHGKKVSELRLAHSNYLLTLLYWMILKSGWKQAAANNITGVESCETVPKVSFGTVKHCARLVLVAPVNRCDRFLFSYFMRRKASQVESVLSHQKLWSAISNGETALEYTSMTQWRSFPSHRLNFSPHTFITSSSTFSLQVSSQPWLILVTHKLTLFR